MSAPHSRQKWLGSANEVRHRGHTNFCAGVEDTTLPMLSRLTARSTSGFQLQSPPRIDEQARGGACASGQPRRRVGGPGRQRDLRRRRGRPARAGDGRGARGPCSDDVDRLPAGDERELAGRLAIDDRARRLGASRRCAARLARVSSRRRVGDVGGAPGAAIGAGDQPLAAPAPGIVAIVAPGSSIQRDQPAVEHGVAARAQRRDRGRAARVIGSRSPGSATTGHARVSASVPSVASSSACVVPMPPSASTRSAAPSSLRAQPAERRERRAARAAGIGDRRRSRRSSSPSVRVSVWPRELSSCARRASLVGERRRVERRRSATAPAR